jgi:ribosomal protein S18 acetylase RimI-like enzyme
MAGSFCDVLLWKILKIYPNGRIAVGQTLQTRLLDASDVELVCAHREKIFLEAGKDPQTLTTMTASFRDWLKPRLLDGSYFGFAVTDNGKPVAGIGLMTIDWPPHPSHPQQDKRGYVLNLYVETSHRGQGIGKRLMQMAEDEFVRRGIQFAILHVTAMGRPMYEGLGWGGTSEMAKGVLG